MQPITMQPITMRNALGESILATVQDTSLVALWEQGGSRWPAAATAPRLLQKTRAMDNAPALLRLLFIQLCAFEPRRPLQLIIGA